VTLGPLLPLSLLLHLPLFFRPVIHCSVSSLFAAFPCRKRAFPKKYTLFTFYYPEGGPDLFFSFCRSTPPFHFRTFLFFSYLCPPFFCLVPSPFPLVPPIWVPWSPHLTPSHTPSRTYPSTRPIPATIPFLLPPI
jgi:hypothetical protein